MSDQLIQMMQEQFENERGASKMWLHKEPSSVYTTPDKEKAVKACDEWNQIDDEEWTAKVEPFGKNLWTVMLYDEDGYKLGSMPFECELILNDDGSIKSCKVG